MEFNLFIALIAVFLNIILSMVIPCLLKDSDQSFIVDIKKVFTNNKDLILVSSLILGLTVYLALMIGPSLNTGFGDIVSKSVDTAQDNMPLKYFLRLRSN
uniref:Uncharacterized protein n=1 Tax=viral metagenome TaxID=1070528 RepID=A0A6C0EFR6_9ZZZZ